LAVVLGSGWLLGIVALLMVGQPVGHVATWGRLLARYGFALPGGVLAALGLRQQARRTMGSRMLDQAKIPLRATGVSLGVFAALAALHPLADSIGFPSSSLFTACGLGLTVSIVWALTVVQREIEHWIEDVERSQALSTDRERISRDLHDGTIQAIYAAGLMLEGVMHLIPEDPDAAQVQLSRTMSSLNQTIQDIRRYIFDLRGNLPTANLETGLNQLLRDFRINTLLETELDVIGEEPRLLRAEQRNHIFQVVREALSNVARHARARKVEVELAFREDHLYLRIADDGIGLGQGPIDGGQGLRNMQERMRLLDGTMNIDSPPGRGVEIALVVPY
jgi:signal transduction histidine kinase